jgi:catechol 2,3-dioxygenase-like lactoylglutathione lyase family enzyme
MADVEPQHVVFVVPTGDLRTSLRFYRDALGLRLVEEWSDMGSGALLRIATNAEVELIEVVDLAAVTEPRMGIGLEVDDEAVDTVYERIVALGFVVKAPPRVRPWGKRGFGAIAPEGTPVNVYGPQAGETDEGRDTVRA